MFYSKMSLKDNAKLASLGRDVYRYARNVASQNSVEPGEVLLQALHFHMYGSKDSVDTQIGDKSSESQTLTDSLKTSQSKTANKIVRESPMTKSPSTSKDGTNIEYDKTEELSAQKLNALSDKNSTTDLGTSGANDDNELICIEDLPYVTGDDGNKIEKEKETPTTEPEKAPDYFDMDCEEIDENVNEEKDVGKPKDKAGPCDVSDVPSIFVIDDDDDDENIKDTAQETELLNKVNAIIGSVKTNKGGDNESQCVQNKDSCEPDSTNAVDTNTDMGSIDVIDIDSDSEEEKEKTNTNTEVRNVSNVQNQTDDSVKPVSIVRLFTNKAQKGGSTAPFSGDISDILPGNVNQTVSDNQSTENLGGSVGSHNLYADNFTDRDDILRMKALGLVSVQDNFLDDMHIKDEVHKRLYSEMASGGNGLVCAEQLSMPGEAPSSPRIKKRLLDFDKKWNMAPQYSPQQDKYLAHPGGIEANAYNGDVTRHLMPSVTHMVGTEFRKPGIYTSVSTCHPNVVIESVDSNQPMHTDTMEGYVNHYGSHEQELENVDEDENDSDYSDYSSRSYKSSRSNHSTKSNKSTKGNNGSKVQSARKNLEQSLYNMKKTTKSERTRGSGQKRDRSRGQSRGQSRLRGRGYRGRTSSAGRGSIRGQNKTTNSTSVGRGMGSSRGSVRGRGSTRGRFTGLLTKSSRGTGRGSSLSSTNSSRGSRRGQGSSRIRSSKGSTQGRGDSPPDSPKGKKFSGFAVGLLNTVSKQFKHAKIGNVKKGLSQIGNRVPHKTASSKITSKKVAVTAKKGQLLGPRSSKNLDKKKATTLTKVDGRSKSKRGRAIKVSKKFQEYREAEEEVIVLD